MPGIHPEFRTARETCPRLRRQGHRSLTGSVRGKAAGRRWLGARERGSCGHLGENSERGLGRCIVLGDADIQRHEWAWHCQPERQLGDEGMSRGTASRA
jgi:hypothetical protein